LSFVKKNQDEYITAAVDKVWDQMQCCRFDVCWLRARTNRRTFSKNLIKHIFTKNINAEIRHKSAHNLFVHNKDYEISEMKYYINRVRVCNYCWIAVHNFTKRNFQNIRFLNIHLLIYTF